MNDTMSPTAKLVAAATEAVEFWMNESYRLEGTEEEWPAEDAYLEAREAHEAAKRAHRAARRANGDNV